MKKTLALLLLLAGLSVEAQGDVLTWTGAENSDWRFWDVTNWVDESGKPTVYHDGDAVVFNDNGARFVYVWGVSPGNILVENNSGHEYYFKGEGQGYIGGPGGLTKKGEGSLTISIRTCTCDYAGSTDIYGGSIVTYADAMLGETFDVWLGKDVIHLYGGALHVDYGTLRNNIIVDGTATLYCGYLGGTLTLCDSSKLTLTGFLAERGGDVILKDNSTLDLGGNSISSFSGMSGPLRTYGAINVKGNASIGNGEIMNCMLNVEEGKTLTLLANTSATSGTVFNLGEGATLNLGGNSVNFVDASISASGNSAGIGNGTITGDLTVAAGKQINLLAGTTITGGVNLGDNASLDLGKNAVTANTLTFNGDSATIGNGTVEGNLTVAVGKSLVLLANTTVTGGVSLGAQSSLNLGGNTFHTGGDACNRVTFSGGTTVSNGKLVLDSDWSPGYALTFTGITLDLNKHTLSKPVTLVGDNAIGNGTLNTYLNVGEGNTLTLCGNLDGQQNQDDKIILGNNATLDLNNHSISKYCYVRVNGDAFIGNGSCYSEVVVEEGKKLTLCGNLSGIGWNMGNIILKDKATLDLGKHTYSGHLSVDEDTATIGNGTLERDLSVGDGKTLNLCGDLGGSGTISMSGSATLNIGTHTLSKNVALNGTSTVTADKTTIKALNTDKEGLLKELSVSDGLIAGTDRQSSLADGLDINRMGYNLELKNLVLTANNSISVGNGHSITLNNVTIKLSQAHYDETEGVFLFDLGTLINCDLVMENVLLDASNLSLPEGFDPANKSVVFDFGDDVTIKQATGLDMRLGNYWSPSLNLDEQGKVIFTKLVDTPEPTTGVLSLLGLGLLAGRRRRHN